MRLGAAITVQVMRIIVIGATGTIGRAVTDALAERHEVLRASRRGPLRVDIADGPSIAALFDATGDVDAVVCCAASGALAPIDTPSDRTYWEGLDGKLIGQVTLVRRALAHVRDGGSITLTSGRFARPIPGSSLGHLVNAGLEAFVHAAAVDCGWCRATAASTPSGSNAAN